MEELLFKQISHITYLKTRDCNDVEEIPQGSVYKSLFYEVEHDVAVEDEVESFWGSEFVPRYRAHKDRWNYKNFVGNTEFIEEKSKHSLQFVNGKWLSMPELTVHFLDQSTKTLHFTSDSELNEYIKRNFSDFHIFNNKKQIRL